MPDRTTTGKSRLGASRMKKKSWWTRYLALALFATVLLGIHQPYWTTVFRPPFLFSSYNCVVFLCHVFSKHCAIISKKKSAISGYLLTISTLSLSVHYFIKYFICKTIKSFISLESGRSVKNIFPSDMYALLSELSTVCSKPVERHAAILKISKF